MPTFSRSKFDEATAAAMVRASPDATTAAMAQAATDFLSQKLRELQLTEPKTDGLLLFERVMAAYPACARLVVTPFFTGYAAAVENITEEV
jgi:hypothetical protein